MKQEQDLAAKIAAQTAKKTAKVESAAAKKIAAAEKAAQKKTAAAERKMLKRADKAEKQAAKISAKVAKAEKKAAAKVAKVEKKAAAKSEKAARLAAKRGERASAAEGAEEGKKKGGKKKLLLVLPIVAIAAAAGVFFFLKGRGAPAEDPLEPIAPPVQYLFGETDFAPALPIVGEEVVVYSETVEPPSPAEGEEAQEPTATRYTYENLQDPKGLMSAYAALLTQSDAGFSAVNEELQRMDLPDFEGREASGEEEAVPAATSVHLARNSGEENIIYSIQLDWSETSGTVVVDTPEGRVTNPPAPEQERPLGNGLTVDGFRQLDPSVLGLPGASMDEYQVYVQDGMLLVYGNTCLRISVYAQNSETGTNEIAGSYFLSADGQHVYSYDVANNSVEELEIPPQ